MGADNLRRAHGVHPVAALEIEYALACRFIEPEILPAARELGIAIVPYRVLADGLLSGPVTGEPVGHMVPPSMQGDNLRHNLATASLVIEMAARNGIAPAQLSQRGEDIIPIVGMRRRSRLPENLAILEVSFDAQELAALDRAFAPGAIRGDRYPAMVMKYAAR